MRRMTDILTLTSATDLKVLTEANELLFKADALKSKAYKRLLKMVTKSSLEGRYGGSFELLKYEDERLLEVFIEVLKSAGYSVVHDRDKATLLVSWL